MKMQMNDFAMTGVIFLSRAQLQSYLHRMPGSVGKNAVSRSQSICLECCNRC